MKSILHTIFWFSVMAFAVSCANIVTPTGGEKDIEPPKVITAVPENRGLNFPGGTIKINFNEFVNLNDIFSQVVVSPYLKKQPEIKIRGKSVLIIFKDSLSPSTTYTISFGNAIEDITEKNILKDYNYSFSTGNSFDSLFIIGSVLNAFTLKPESGVYVMLYNNYIDSVPYIKPPFYISKTDASGLFKLNNIRNDKYKIFALKDVDADLLFSQPNEEIAFAEGLVKPEIRDTFKNDSIVVKPTITLHLFKELPLNQKLLKSYSSEFGKVVLVFRLPVNRLSIKALVPGFMPENYIEEYSKNADTITLWLKNYEKDSLMLQINDNYYSNDTVVLALKKKNASHSGRGEETAKTVRLTTSVFSSEFDFYKKFNIQTSAPIDTYDFSKIFLIGSFDTLKPVFVFTDSVKRNLTMLHNWKEDLTYSLFVLPGAFNDIYGNTNDSIKVLFKTTKAENYGNIELNLYAEKYESGSYIIQLLNKNDAVIDLQKTNKSSSVEFKNIRPGTYKARVIFDMNLNDKWDTGNYLKNIQPEKVLYYPSELTVKANWDQKIEWHISE